MSLRNKFAVVAVYTPVLFATGDFAAATATAEYLGIISNALAASSAIRARWKNIPGLGYYSIAAVSALTAVSTVLKGATIDGKTLTEGLDFMFSLPAFKNPATREAWLNTAAFAIWTYALILSGGQEKNKTKPKGPLDTPETHYGVAATAFAYTEGGLATSAVFGAAALRACVKDNASSILQKHITPARLMALGCVVGGVSVVADYMSSTAANPDLWKAAWKTAAFALWTGGYYRMNAKSAPALKN